MAIGLQSILSTFVSSLSTDFKKKNFSLYGQWISLITVLLCIALGVANIFHASVVVVFSIICIVQGVLVVFVEIPFFLRICPLTDRFVSFVRNFDENLPRCGFYLLMAVIQWLSLTVKVTSLIVVAVFFTISSGCYLLSAILKQEYTKTSLHVSDNGDSVEGQASAHIARNVL